MKKLFLTLNLVCNIAILSSTVNAQYPVRMAAEFDPCVGTLITWPLGIPQALVVDLAKEDMLYIAVGSTSEQTSAISQFTAWGVNLNNCMFVQAPHNSHWSRDWGPNCTFDSTGVAGILDFIFKGYPQVPGCGGSGNEFVFQTGPKDDAVNAIVASVMGLPLRFMPSYFVGGNNMVDGLGTAISSQQMINENEKNAIDSATFRNYTETYCGITNYYFVDKPDGFGIQHIDCFAKFLDEETILIKQVNSTNPDYDCVEQLANQVKAMNSSYGRPYKIVRILAGEYSGTKTAAYTNALILNKKVYVPLFGISTDSMALATYRNAMPGYTVTGYTASGASKWYYYDALHCRTMGLFDKDMLRIVHRPLDSIVTVTSNSIPIVVAVDSRSGQGLIPDSCLLYWRLKVHRHGKASN
jgi:agmatine/peptidylarginine deiminase